MLDWVSNIDPKTWQQMSRWRLFFSGFNFFFYLYFSFDWRMCCQHPPALFSWIWSSWTCSVFSFGSSGDKILHTEAQLKNLLICFFGSSCSLCYWCCCVTSFSIKSQMWRQVFSALFTLLALIRNQYSLIKVCEYAARWFVLIHPHSELLHRTWRGVSLFFKRYLKLTTHNCACL